MTEVEPPYQMARRTCAELLQVSNEDKTPPLPVRLDPEAAVKFADELDVAAVKAFGASLANDANFTGTTCQFESVDAEAAFILLMHALDFGSGWRPELHMHHRKGAWLTIKPGVEALYKLAPNLGLTSEWLCSLTLHDVASAFSLQNNSSLDLLVKYLLDALHELGTNSVYFGSLEAFVTATFEKTSPSAAPAGNFILALVNQFPKTFDDQYIIRTQRVCFFKKAQLVVGEMYHRFRDEDSRFAFSDGELLTAYVDNVICAAMRYKGIVVPSEQLVDMIEAGVEVESGSECEVSLRAAAMCAVDLVVAATNKALTSAELGNYLWGGLGKEPAVRKFQRHATKTRFY
jgi:hypothetical protein